MAAHVAPRCLLLLFLIGSNLSVLRMSERWLTSPRYQTRSNGFARITCWARWAFDLEDGSREKSRHEENFLSGRNKRSAGVREITLQSQPGVAVASRRTKGVPE